MKKIILALFFIGTITIADTTAEQNQVLSDYLTYVSKHNYPGGVNQAITDLMSSKPEAIALLKKFVNGELPDQNIDKK